MKSMTHRRSVLLLAGAAVALVALAIAGCGGGASAPPSKNTGGRATAVAVTSTGLGKTLVDSSGRTLYLFEKDSGARSSCSGACAGAWPPLLASGRATVAGGANAALLGTTARSDGARQVTYNGHPLYLYIRDREPGDTNGQGVDAFGAEWYALSPAGDPLDEEPAGSGGAPATGGGDGF